MTSLENDVTFSEDSIKEASVPMDEITTEKEIDETGQR